MDLCTRRLRFGRNKNLNNNGRACELQKNGKKKTATMRRRRGNPRRDEMAAGVKAALRATFGDKFPMTKQKRSKKEKLLLKVYVVDVSEGDRESRIYAPDCEVGLVRLCLAWIACTPDGNIVYDGGRVGMTDGLGMGVLDALHLTLPNLVIQLAATGGSETEQYQNSFYPTNSTTTTNNAASHPPTQNHGM